MKEFSYDQKNSKTSYLKEFFDFSPSLLTKEEFIEAPLHWTFPSL